MTILSEACEKQCQWYLFVFKVTPSDGRRGQKRANPAKPSKFQVGKITHNGYVCDAGGRIMPWWANKADPNCPDPTKMKYQSVRRPVFEPKETQNVRPDIDGKVI